MQHGQIFHFSLEIEFNALRFINYPIPRLCSTYVVATFLGRLLILCDGNLSFLYVNEIQKILV